MTQAKVGDTVHLTKDDSARWAGTYTVVKVNPTTYQLERVADGALKAGHDQVRSGPLLDARTQAPMEPDVERFESGSVVHMRNVRNVDPNKYWVVTGQTARGYRLFPLGGSPRYYTGIPASRLVRVAEINGWKADAGVPDPDALESANQLTRDQASTAIEALTEALEVRRREAESEPVDAETVGADQ